MQTKSKDLFKDQAFFIGIDTHKKSWKVSILGEQYEHKTFSQNPDPALLASYLKKNFPGEIYKSVYEAGFSGLNRKLTQAVPGCVFAHLNPE